MRVFVDNDTKDSFSREGLETTQRIREGVARAVRIQRERQAVKNARLTPQEMEFYCKVDFESRKILDFGIQKYGFSPRAVASLLKVSRTIADIDGSDKICERPVQAASELRKLCSDIVPEIQS